jgi:hypothetical protein
VIHYDDQAWQFFVGNRCQNPADTIDRLRFAVVAAAQKNESGTLGAKTGEQSWEVQVGCSQHSILRRGNPQNLPVRSPIQAELARVNGIVAP